MGHETQFCPRAFLNFSAKTSSQKMILSIGLKRDYWLRWYHLIKEVQRGTNNDNFIYHD